MSGIIGKKVGMTSIFEASGKNVPCTVIEAGPCVVTQIKSMDNDGYDAIQLAYDEKKDISFGTVGPGKWTPIHLQAGQVAVLWPEDAHAPKLAAGGPSPVMKIVVKVVVE